MQGIIKQINISSGGIPKKPTASAYVSSERVQGDDWNNKNVHGGPRQVVLMIANETYQSLVQLGYPVFPGALGENFTTEGLAYAPIRFGDTFLVGGKLILRITKLRGPCNTIKVYGADIGTHLYDALARDGNPESPHWGTGGFYAEVLQEGTVQAGDVIRIKKD